MKKNLLNCAILCIGISDFRARVRTPASIFHVGGNSLGSDETIFAAIHLRRNDHTTYSFEVACVPVAPRSRACTGIVSAVLTQLLCPGFGQPCPHCWPFIDPTGGHTPGSSRRPSQPHRTSGDLFGAARIASKRLEDGFHFGVNQAWLRSPPN